MRSRVAVGIAVGVLAAAGCGGGGGGGEAAAPPPGPPPVLAFVSIRPTQGPTTGGTQVTITGSGFVSAGVSAVEFAATAGTSLVVSSDTQLLVSTPSASAGAVSVTIRSGGSAPAVTEPNAFLYLAGSPPAPTVSSVSPSSGPATGGTAVTVAGSAFQTGATVTVGGGPCTSVTVLTASRISAATPAGFVGPATVVVTNPDTQSGSLSSGFTYTAVWPAPTVSSVTPSRGPATLTTTVTIVGTGFRAGATVAFGPNFGGVVSLSSTQIVATAPTGGPGSVAVTVTNSDGQSASGSFLYDPAPTVSSVSPGSGPTSGGTAVTIAGTGFLAGATVYIGSGAATGIVVVSSTTITCATPAGSAGAANVQVTNTDTQAGILPGGYTFVPPPAVLSVTPNASATVGGTAVTIAGTGFQAGATASFGTAIATSVAIASATSITCVTPTPAGSGAVPVTVTNPDGQSGTLANGFVYSATPTVSSVAPFSGPSTGAQLVTITGTGIFPGATADLGGSALTGVTVPSSTTLVGTTSVHAVGTVAATVTNPAGFSATAPSAYTYNPGVDVQTQAYVFDTSSGIDCRRRWYVNSSAPAYLKDLQNLGLQTWGTPGDTTAPPATPAATDLYARDWARAYTLRTLSIAYGRNGDGTKISGTSMNVTFVGLAPATGAQGCGTPSTGWAIVCVGGCDPGGNGGPHPSASQSACNSGAIGASMFDTPSGSSCNTAAENSCDSTYHTCTSCTGSGVGIFCSLIVNAWGASLPGGRLTTTDQQYLDGTTNSGTRYNQIHDFLKQWARRCAFVLAHECGHAMGLVATSTTGTCTVSNGLCGASGAHNDCCTTNIMVTVGSFITAASLTDTSLAFSGQPGSVSAAASCSTGGVSSWALLTSFVGISP
ncbi:MAG: IPT/TIG domain-containing protein [Planctomycetales bacterium]|nr:IPT/TIG domain-containing protein [Planctomycetales bacterium]